MKISYKSILGRGDHNPPGACASIHLHSTAPDATTKVTISYTDPQTKKVIKESTQILTYKSVESLYPSEPKVGHQPPEIVLPVGSSKDILIRGGPTAWPSKPSNFFREGKLEIPMS